MVFMLFVVTGESGVTNRHVVIGGSGVTNRHVVLGGSGVTNRHVVLGYRSVTFRHKRNKESESCIMVIYSDLMNLFPK